MPPAQPPRKYKSAGVNDAPKPSKLERSQQWADLVLKILSCIAIPATGVWAYYQYDLKGADDWVNNMSITTEVLPYTDKLRLLAVHIKSKNPTSATLNLNRGRSTFNLVVRKIPEGLKEGATIDETAGETIAKIDLLEEDMELLPNAEFDEMRVIVVPVNSTLSVAATMENENGTLTAQGKPDHDFVSIATVIPIADKNPH